MSGESAARAVSFLDGRFAVCRLPPDEALPDWANRSGFCSVTRTADELSIVCDEQAVPEETLCERGFRALKLEGPFDFSEIGILSSFAEVLAQAGIPILAVSTYDTDYILVRAGDADEAALCLTQAGHRVSI
jgi:hypothetical protein